ncbi:HNH endonuclease signature motif containing protein [Bradyrhizobium sp. A5]|uniref:HNH endonuclease n=1 Tax=Bradyrhizobium sp. A5 TaxID=3133696 RepID=UPI00324A776E
MNAAAKRGKKTIKRPPIPAAIQSKLLIENRHACCVCQKVRVQIHHIDGDPKNNELANLAALCVDHHDMASMQLGLTKKLKPNEVRTYKKEWEARCAADMKALSRDRENFFVTLYKNPPRIREQFSRLPDSVRRAAVVDVARAIAGEEKDKLKEGGFNFQMLPRRNDMTLACLASAEKGQFWPEWLPRVQGHPKDPDYPTDLSPPNGMTAFHGFDLYCQILIRVLTAASVPVPLEQILSLGNAQLMNTWAGSLVSFRERAIGKGVTVPSLDHSRPTASLQFRHRQGKKLLRTRMELRTMYVFSDTAAMNLRSSRTCGIGVFGGADVGSADADITLSIVPLLIGMGGFGQSDASGWSWSLR